MIEDDARRAYEEGGRERLAAHLQRLDSSLPGKHLLTDARGRDLVTGEDRSRPARQRQAPGGPSSPARRPDGHGRSRPRQPVPLHHPRTALVRATQSPALLRGGRPGHRGNGLDPGGPPGRAFASLAQSRGTVRPRRPQGTVRVEAQGRDRRALAILRRDGRADRGPALGRAAALAGRLARAPLAPGPPWASLWSWPGKTTSAIWRWPGSAKRRTG